MMPRLRERYQRELVPALTEKFSYGSTMAVPRLSKIVVNMGVGKAQDDIKLMDRAIEELGQITGQRPAIRRARKSIANFKLKEGSPIGCRVTLRGRRMYEFMDRLVTVALPRVRDFRGLSTRSFDGRGNYTALARITTPTTPSLISRFRDTLPPRPQQSALCYSFTTRST